MMHSTSELAEILLKTAPEHEGWSIVESPNAEGRFEDLLAWAEGMTIHTWESERRERAPKLGLVLLWLESEVARRRGGEGTLWPILSDQQIVPWDPRVHGELFTGTGSATPKHRKLLEDTARRFDLRHTFDEQGMNWFRLIYLQFGFTHDDAVKRLADWLSGQILPISVQRLLGGADSGARSFQQLWHSLRAFRLGNLSQVLTESRIRESPWVLAEWCADLIAAAKKSKAQALELGDKEAAEVAFFTTPQLTWNLAHPPVFTTSLCHLQDLGLEAPDYHLKTGDVILARLMRQGDGSYLSDAGENIVLPLEPIVPLSLVDPASAEIAAYDEAILWDVQEEVNRYSTRTGLRVLPGERLRSGVELFLVASGDLEIHPKPSVSVDLQLGYRLHYLARGWTGEISATLDGDPIWTAASSAMDQGGPGRVVSAQVESRLDLRDDRMSKGPPWTVDVRFKANAGWRIVSIRQRKHEEDGAVWTHLSGNIDSFEALEWTNSGVGMGSVKRVIPVSEMDCLRALLFRVGLQSGDRRRTELVKSDVPCVGVFKWNKFGIPECNPLGNNLLLSEARQHTWTFSLPEQSDDVEDAGEFHLREGNHLVDRVRSRPVRIPDLGGYGAPLCIVGNPYQSRDVIMEVAPCVLDGGALGPVSWQPEVGGFDIRSSFTDLGDEHQLFAWRDTEVDGGSVVEIPRHELLDEESGWMWKTDNEHRLHAVALTFRGIRLGSWFHHQTWSRAAASPSADPALTAALLRAWKAPILKEEGEHFHTMADWFSEHLEDVLPVWLSRVPQQGPGGVNWPMPNPDMPWMSSVGDLLLETLPSPDVDQVGAIVEALAPGAKGINALGKAFWTLLDVCPILAARVVKVYLAEFANAQDNMGFRQTFPHLLANELDAIDRNQFGDNVGLDHERQAEKIAKRRGKRDGGWLATTVPTLERIDVGGQAALCPAFRILTKSHDYRLYCLSMWWNEL